MSTQANTRANLTQQQCEILDKFIEQLKSEKLSHREQAVRIIGILLLKFTLKFSIVTSLASCAFYVLAITH